MKLNELLKTPEIFKETKFKDLKWKKPIEYIEPIEDIEELEELEELEEEDILPSRVKEGEKRYFPSLEIRVNTGLELNEKRVRRDILEGIYSFLRKNPHNISVSLKNLYREMNNKGNIEQFKLILLKMQTEEKLNLGYVTNFNGVKDPKFAIDSPFGTMYYVSIRRKYVL